MFPPLADADNGPPGGTHCGSGGTGCGGLYPNVLQQAVSFATNKAIYLNPNGRKGILVVGINGGGAGGGTTGYYDYNTQNNYNQYMNCATSPAYNQFTYWYKQAGLSEPITYLTDPAQIASVDFTQYKVWEELASL